jgi:hypothetical protein
MRSLRRHTRLIALVLATGSTLLAGGCHSGVTTPTPTLGVQASPEFAVSAYVVTHGYPFGEDSEMQLYNVELLRSVSPNVAICRAAFESKEPAGPSGYAVDVRVTYKLTRDASNDPWSVRLVSRRPR